MGPKNKENDDPKIDSKPHPNPENVIQCIRRDVEEWSQQCNIPTDHNMPNHIVHVYDTCCRAAAAPGQVLSIYERTVICLAALLHEVDDPKCIPYSLDFFPSLAAALPHDKDIQQNSEKTKADALHQDKKEKAQSDASPVNLEKKKEQETTCNATLYPRAEFLLQKYMAPDSALFHDTLECIGYVSCSKVGDYVDPKVEQWKYLVRDADRKEAIGRIGIVRCFQVARRLKNPLFIHNVTPIPKSEKDLQTLLSTRSLAKYIAQGGKSARVMDHFVDKLLLLQPATTNPVIVAEWKQHHNVMKDWYLETCSRIHEGKLRPSSMECILNVPLSDIAAVASGLNIEGGMPALDHPVDVFANVVIAFDHPLETNGIAFSQLQQEKKDKGYPFLESVDPRIDERSFLTYYLAAIAFYSERYDHMVVHVHQMKQDGLSLISFLRSHLTTMGIDPETIQWQCDDVSYAQSHILMAQDAAGGKDKDAKSITVKDSEADKEDTNGSSSSSKEKTKEYALVLKSEAALRFEARIKESQAKVGGKRKAAPSTVRLSLSQCALLNLKMKPGDFFIPTTFTRFNVHQNTIDTTKQYTVENDLVKHCDAIVKSRFYTSAQAVLADYQSMNSLKANRDTTPIFHFSPFLQVDGIWEPKSDAEVVQVIY